MEIKDWLNLDGLPVQKFKKHELSDCAAFCLHFVQRQQIVLFPPVVVVQFGFLMAFLFSGHQSCSWIPDLAHRVPLPLCGVMQCFCHCLWASPFICRPYPVQQSCFFLKAFPWFPAELAGTAQPKQDIVQALFLTELQITESMSWGVLWRKDTSTYALADIVSSLKKDVINLLWETHPLQSNFTIHSNSLTFLCSHHTQFWLWGDWCNSIHLSPEPFTLQLGE